MKKKICLVTSVHTAFDDRIFHKQAKSLKNAGYQVILIAQHDKEEFVDGVKIIPLPRPKNRLERLTKTQWKILKTTLKQDSSFFHFHDPELIPTGLFLKLFFRKIVIYDLHEFVFADIEDKEWIQSKFVKKVIQFTYLFMERLSLVFFDHLVLARDDTETHLKNRHKKYNNHTVVKNFPILSLINKAEPELSLRQKKPIVFYAGLLSYDRGIETLIQSIELVKDEAILWLLGKWENEEFKKKCESLRGWRNTKYFGVVPFNNVFNYMKSASIGIFVPHAKKNFVTNLPIKTFEYMACSLPLVMSDFPYWRQLFGEYAVFANPYDPKDITEKIFNLLNNPSEMEEMGLKGKQKVVSEYNWEFESKKLLNLYKEFSA